LSAASRDAAALGRELQVSERTIYRDLSELTAQGAPVQGEAGGGAVSPSRPFPAPLMLTEDERKPSHSGYDMLINAATTSLSKPREMPTPRILAA
jgi:predicted DNA-binding transcriptional regulator YafY